MTRSWRLDIPETYNIKTLIKLFLMIVSYTHRLVPSPIIIRQASAVDGSRLRDPQSNIRQRKSLNWRSPSGPPQNKERKNSRSHRCRGNQKNKIEVVTTELT